MHFLCVRVRRLYRSFEQLLHLILISTSFNLQGPDSPIFHKRQTTRNPESPNPELPNSESPNSSEIQNRKIHQKSRIVKFFSNPESSKSARIAESVAYCSVLTLVWQFHHIFTSSTMVLSAQLLLDYFYLAGLFMSVDNLSN